MIKLKVTYEERTKILIFNKNTVTIGSSPLADIQIDDPKMKEIHACISVSGNHFFINHYSHHLSVKSQGRDLAPDKKHMFATFLPVNLLPNLEVHLHRASYDSQEYFQFEEDIA